MGAWGPGIFDNDAACDFAAAVADGGGILLMGQTLDRVLACGSGYLERSDAEECLAAADIIARLNGSPGNETAYTAAIDAWIKSSRVSVSPEVIEKARQAISRVLSPPSEIVEIGVWKNSEVFDRWRRGVEDLLARL